MCDSSKDKWNWMSMLCYAQYKFTVDRLLQQMTEEQNREYTLPIPPDNYIFDWPDSPETIIFDQQSNSGVNPYLSSENLLIRAATLIKLVERLTHHQYLYPKFSHTFLMCYREFCTSHELFNLLSQRYDVPDLSLKQVELEKYTSGGIIERELFKRYKREYQQPIRLKVINVIKHWIYGYFYDDFANDSDLLQKLHDFILKVGLSNQRYKQVLLNILNKKLSQRQKINVLNDSDISRLESLSLNSDASINSDKVSNKVHTLTSSLTNSGFPIKTTSSRTSSSSTIDDGVGSFSTSSRLTTPNDSIDRAGDFFYDDMPAFETHLENSFPYDILTIHPLEFARQATLMESELFKAIKPSELISLGWNKPDQRYKLSPNLTKLINLSNKFTYWYAKCIVDTLNIEERVAVVLRILDIAEYFYEMNNFSGLKEIYASLETSSVIRLETTREKSSVEQHKMYAIFKQLFENHDRGYLERIKKCNPPCVPFIGSHLSIILKTQEYNKLNDENHKRKIIMQQQQLKKEEALSNEDGSESSAPANFSILAKTHLINFSKYRILVEFVNDLLQYQNMSYKYRVHEKIHSFILEDIENYFKAAQNALESKEDEFESKLNFTDTNSCSSEVINMSRPDPSQMVEAWLFARSKQIEPKEVFHYPRIKNYPLKAPPMTDKSTSKISKSSTFSQPNLSKTDSNKSINKLARNDKLKNSASMHNSKLSSSGNCNDVIDKFAGSQSLTSRNIFQKRSNSSIQQLKLPDRINMSSTSPSPSPSPSPTHSKYSGKFSQTATTNILNKLLSSSSQMSLSSSNNNSTAGIPNSSTAFTLASSSSSAMSSSQMFPSSTNISSSIAPFGSFYSPSANTVANTFFAASSPQPSQSSNQNISSVLQNNISGSSTNITDQSRTSGSSSSVNGALSSVCYAIGHGHEKLSLSSADSSSSAPNSPPPNYDEVFDSSSIANTFNFTGYNNLPNNQANSYLIPNNVNNCYDNKTYFQRMDSNFDESQQNIQIHKTLNDVSTMKSCKNQPSVFSFPDLSEQNEEIKMSSRANSTDFLSSSSSIQSSPLLPQEDLYMNKKTVQHAFNMLEPPPLRPPPPPPTEPPAIPALPSNMQLKSSVHSMRNSSSQLSLNLNAPPPPVYPPPPPILNNEDQIGILRQPPPIPARPGKNSQLNQ